MKFKVTSSCQYVGLACLNQCTSDKKSTQCSKIKIKIKHRQGGVSVHLQEHWTKKCSKYVLNKHSLDSLEDICCGQLSVQFPPTVCVLVSVVHCAVWTSTTPN